MTLPSSKPRRGLSAGSCPWIWGETGCQSQSCFQEEDRAKGLVPTTAQVGLGSWNGKQPSYIIIFHAG